MGRSTRGRSRFLRLSGHLIDASSHIHNRPTRFPNFVQLFVGGCQQFGRCCIHVSGRLRNPGGRVLHVGHQRAQLFNGVIHGVSDRTRNVFRDGRLLRQIAFSATVCNSFIKRKMAA